MNFPKLWLVLALVLAAVGCSSVTKTPPPSTDTAQITVQLNQTSVILLEGETEQFTAVVQGTTNTAVSWSVDSVNGGSATTGTITASGLYTAPSQPGTHTVIATAKTDTSKSATAGIAVGNLSLTPTTAGIITNSTVQFTAAFTGQTTPSLVWSVDGVSGDNPSVGTISGSGLYTAPGQSGNHTIAVALASQPKASESASVTVFSFSLYPGFSLIALGATQQFSATIQGITNTAVAWSVDGIAGGNSSVGTISLGGLYTAPNAIGTHTVVATSVAYSAESVKAALTVQNVAHTAVLTYHNDDTRDGAYLER